MELTTLADVRMLVEKHLPAEYRSKFTWRHLAGLLKRAAEGQQNVADPVLLTTHQGLAHKAYQVG